jgi:signal transduction histidine kinase
MAVRTRPRRTRSARFTLAALLVIPLISLVTLWAFAASLTLGPALTERTNTALIDKGNKVSVGLLEAVSLEREESYIWLSSGRLAPEKPLLADRKRTSALAVSYRSLAVYDRPLEPAQANAAQTALVVALGKLPAIRAAVDGGTMTAIGAFEAYSAIVDAQFAYYSVDTSQNVELYRQTNGSIYAARATEMLGREVGLVAAAPITRGILSSAVREQFATSVADQRQLISVALGTLSGPERAVYAKLYASPAHQRLAALEDKISASVGSRARLPVSLRAWQAASGAFLADMQKAEAAQAAPLAELEIDNGDSLLLRAVLAGGLGLVAVVASILLTVWFGRRLTGELTGLHDSAESIANERLPGLVERLRRGDDVDAAAESPPPAPGKITEIAKVAESFATVQRTAVEAAVGQANLRKGVNQVFLNLSLRNQSLLHRQLSMLDSMERAARDPAALEELFRLDHLTTRMRRHAEGLIILSGATPGRGWRDPVPVIDVLRAAVAEVEDYVRVDVVSESRDSVVGPAVNDVIHLLAELLENATSFSPPNTQVEVRADAVGSGFAIEVEDRGLGLTPPELEQINERLARPPEFDLANSDQLGLFVVAQLAARHGIKVSLRESPYRGIRAIVLLPHNVIVSAAEPDEPGTGELRAAESANGSLPPPAPVVNRARASAFSPTGRHKLPSEPPAAEITAAPPLAAPPPAAPPQAPPAASPGTSTGAERTHLGLPVRVRQNSLAPQLRSEAPEPAGPGPARPGLEFRSPEHARSLMAAMQEGWQHGRTDQLEEPGFPAGDPDGEETR